MDDEFRRRRAQRIGAVGFDYEGQPKEWLDRCNLCGDDRWTIITHWDRYGYSASSSSCMSCSLTVLNPRMTPDAYGDFYRSTYRPLVSAFHDQLIDAQTIKFEQVEYSKQIAETIRRFHSPSKPWRTLLDIGGSTGVVAQNLAREFDLDATVIDPAPDEIAEAGKFELETIIGFFEEWPSSGRVFDLVGMFQTVDHLLDVSLAFDSARKVLAEDGVFVVDIVDFRAAYLRTWSVEEATKIDHPFSLTQATMEAYLARAGLDVVMRSFSPDHLHVLYVCRKGEPRFDAVPPTSEVARHFSEIRHVQNAVRTTS